VLFSSAGSSSLSTLIHEIIVVIPYAPRHHDLPKASLVGEVYREARPPHSDPQSLLKVLFAAFPPSPRGFRFRAFELSVMVPFPPFNELSL